MAKSPQLLGSYSVDANLRPTVQYFLNGVGIEKDQLRAKIENLPAYWHIINFAQAYHPAAHLHREAKHAAWYSYWKLVDSYRCAVL